MISLTILPSQNQAKLGPLQNIAGEPSSTVHSQSDSNSNSNSNSNRPAGGSLSFASRTRKDVTSSDNNSKQAAMQQKVRIRLAEESTLLPFLNRPIEVKELLLHAECKNKQLFQSLRKLFLSSPYEWTLLQTYLFEVDREELADSDWLSKIYCLIFAKSPSIWCRLADCLGAHSLDWSAFNLEEKDAEDDLDSVFTDSSSSLMTESRSHARFSSQSSNTSGFDLEALDEIPQSFHVPAVRARRPSSYLYSASDLDSTDASPQQKERQHHRSRHHRRESSLISEGEHDDVHHFLTSKQDGFAGLRLSLSNPDHYSWPSRRHHHHMDQKQSSTQLNDDSPINKNTEIRQRGATVPGLSNPLQQQQQHKYINHRRLSNLFMTPSENKETSHQESSTDKSSPNLASPATKRFSPASTFSRSYSTPRFQADDSKSGMLRDGRSRHPSAGDGEGGTSKEAVALLAFKRELQLSGYGNDGEKLNTKASSTRSHSSFSSIFSPPLSEESDATTLSSGNSPVMSKRMFEELQATQSTTGNKDKEQAPSVLIFLLSSSPTRPRSQHLLDRLNTPSNKSTVSTIQSVIGPESYQRLNDIILTKERSQVSDQALLECIAKDCFDLVDCEKDSRETVEAHLIDEHYNQRWDAFVKLCHVWDVDSAVIQEAKRRGGPAMKLF